MLFFHKDGLISYWCFKFLLREHAPNELLQLSDSDLISALGLIRNGKPVRAAFLLAGKESSIKQHFPGYVWTFLKMISDTEYSDRIDGNTAIPVAVMKIIDRIMADNPITTVKQGLFHFEYRTYPKIALREAIMNAFCHSDYRIPKWIGYKENLNNLFLI